MSFKSLERVYKRFKLFKGELYPIHSKELDRYWNRFQLSCSKSSELSSWWFLVPGWLVNNKAAHALSDQKFMEDVLWAQYCIFLSVRILDDIYDMQAKNSNLLFVSHLLQLEADRQFAKYFPHDSSFWKRKNDFQQKTLISIVLTDKLQRKRKVKVKDLFPAYADVASIFKIGISAICKKEKDFTKLKLFYKFADELAIISQLFDDFYDILEDLKLGKINSAVRIILDKLPTGSIDDITKKTAHALQFKNGFNNLAAEIIKHIKTANRIAKKLKIQEALLHVQSFEKALKSLERMQHKKRVEYMFSKIA